MSPVVRFRKLALIQGIALVAGGGALCPAPAEAQGLQSSSLCTTDNLLSHRQPIWRQDVRGDLRLPTDEAVAPEGAQWDAPVGVILETPAGSLTYDLGSVKPVAYKLLVEIDNVVSTQGHGFRTRTATIDATPVRYLKVGEAVGDGAYSI